MARIPTWTTWTTTALLAAACAFDERSSVDDAATVTHTATPTGPVFLEPPEGRLLHGMGQWRPGNDAFLEAAGDPRLEPAAALIFLHLGDWPRRSWERRALSLVDAIESERAAGRVLNVTLHLGGLGPDGEIVGIDDDIARRSPDAERYEARVRDAARIIDASGLPAFVRISGEMNGAWEDQHPYEYPIAYRRVVELFAEEGADDVAWVWCYMPAAEDDFDEYTGHRAKWYPGDDVVDWFGLDVFKREDFVPDASPRGERFGRAMRSERFLAMAREHGKPVILNETSAVDVALTPDRLDGERDWETWFVPFFEFIERHPEIRAVHYVNVDWQTIGAARERGWLNADVSVNPVVLQRLVDELSRPRWLHRDEIALLHGAREAFGPDRLAVERARLQAVIDAEQPRGAAPRRTGDEPAREADPRRGAQRGGR